MFFLKDMFHLVCHLLSNCKYKIEFPLQVRNKNRTRKTRKTRNKELSGKTFSFASQNSQKMGGSLTIEAAFVMPMIIFLTACFSYLMMIMGVQIKLQEALDMAGRRLAGYAYVYEQIGKFSSETEVMQKEPGIKELLRYGLSSAYAWKLIRDYAGEDWLEYYGIVNGKNGVWISGGDMLSEDGVIDLVLHYIVKIPYLPGESTGIHLVSRCRVKAWTGFEKRTEKTEAETEEETVYITETGTVYHTNSNCTHLKLSIDEVALYNLEYIRNQNGGKYYACERCFRNYTGSSAGKVFITKTGDRYHSDMGCSGLKRSITEIPISQVGDRKKCKRCIQNGG